MTLADKLRVVQEFLETCDDCHGCGKCDACHAIAALPDPESAEHEIFMDCRHVHEMAQRRHREELEEVEQQRYELVMALGQRVYDCCAVQSPSTVEPCDRCVSDMKQLKRVAKT